MVLTPYSTKHKKSVWFNAKGDFHVQFPADVCPEPLGMFVFNQPDCYMMQMLHCAADGKNLSWNLHEVDEYIGDHELYSLLRGTPTSTTGWVSGHAVQYPYSIASIKERLRRRMDSNAIHTIQRVWIHHLLSKVAMISIMTPGCKLWKLWCKRYNKMQQ
jgi:hypothetical protein